MTASSLTKVICQSSLLCVLAVFIMTQALPTGNLHRVHKRASGAASTKNNGVDIHGGVKMGNIDNKCDNASWNLHRDWDNSTDIEYKCQTEKPIPIQEGQVLKDCMDKKDIPWPMHRCMDTDIVYKSNDLPPRGGPHRPLWPVYGEYVYIPPQRWLHALEHGAAVFLYHPCADKGQIEQLKINARSCLRRHIITPYRQLPANKPFAVLTWGCKLLMGSVNDADIRDFVKNTALKTDEKHVFRDGDFSWGLIKKAAIVSNLEDNKLCPSENKVIYKESSMINH